MRSSEQELNGHVEHEMLRKLHVDGRVPGAKLSVDVDDGVVTLRGTVESWGAGVVAFRAARRAPGVVGVVSQLVQEHLWIGSR